MGKQSVREQRPKWNREKKTETENLNSLRDAGIQPTGLQQVHFAGLASHVHMECTKPFFFFITRFTCHHSNAHFWIYIWETTPSATIVRWFEVLHMCRLPRFVWLLFSLDGFSIFSLSNYRNRAFRFLFFFHLTFTCENKHNFNGNLNPRRRRWSHICLFLLLLAVQV